MSLRERYWCRHGLVVTVDGPLGVRSTTVEKPFARISTRRGAEVVLPDLKIASRGLYLHATDAGLFGLGFSHTESTEEPFRGWLRPDQIVSLGPYQISARLAGPAGAVPPDLPNLDEKGTAAEPYPVIAVAFGGAEVARRRLSRPLTFVGRLRPSTLPIQSNDLSASHLVFHWNAGTLWVIDLLSRMGTIVEGTPIQCAELPLGCSLTIGEVRLTFVDLHSTRRGKSAGTEAELPREPEPAAGDVETAGEEGAILPEPAVPPPAADAESPGTARAVAAGESPAALRPLPDVLDGQLARLEQARAKLEAREQELRRDQEAWIAQQQRREQQWQRRAVELAGKQALLAAEQQRQRAALEEERRALLAQFDQWKAAADRLGADLSRQQEDFLHRQQEFQDRQAEFQQRQAEFHRHQADVQRQQAELQEQQEDLRRRQSQFQAQHHEWETQRARWEAEVLPIREADAARRAKEAPPDQPDHATPLRIDASAGSPPSEKSENDYNEVLDRLMRVSHERSSWFYRIREAWGGLWGKLKDSLRRRSTANPVQPRQIDSPPG
jgi:hypothetical protein